MYLEIGIILLLMVVAGCMLFGRPLTLNIRIEKDAKIQEVRPEASNVPLPELTEDEKRELKMYGQQQAAIFDGIERISNFLETGDPNHGNDS